jgi:hypothetical protein
MIKQIALSILSLLLLPASFAVAQTYQYRTEPSPMIWTKPDGEKWMIVVWYPPADCSGLGNSLVYCEWAPARLGVTWAKTESEAIKWANDTQSNVLGIYRVEETKLTKTAVQERVPQPDSFRNRIVYKSEKP